MSHELRTPLNGIIGYAHLLQIEGGLTAAQGARVDAMLEAGEHLLQMITCVLDLSEIEAEHVELRLVECDVQAIASACLGLIRPTAERKRLALNIAVAPSTRQELITDPMRLRQILLNLLGNAVKFTELGNIELRLRTLADGSALRIEVADTGPGIPTDLRQRLFQYFERLDIASASTVEGAGLGLALSARLASLMGGRIGHEDNPDGGSIFWLELPVDAIALPAAASDFDRTDISPAPTLARVLRVLVVDDVLMNLDIASSFLHVAGHQATCVDGGAAAVESVAITDFDVVLMDVQMPGMDGLEATRRIRALQGPRGRVPIVALTAQAFTEQVQACHDAGIDVHLSKPFTPDQMLAAIARAMVARQSHGNSPRPVPTPIVEPISPVITVIDDELPVFDLEAFKRTAAFLAPEAVTIYMRTIAQRAEALLCALHEPGRTGDEFTKAAHTLAGSAGMFGFERLATVGRLFERAIESGSPETSILVDNLAAALKATIKSIRNAN